MSWDAPFATVASALFVIVMLRAGTTYVLGRLLRRGGEHGRGAQLMQRPGFTGAAERLNRWGAPAVSLSFLTVGVQTMVNLAAGFTRMPLTRYLPALVLGCIAWACLYATAGFIGLSSTRCTPRWPGAWRCWWQLGSWPSSGHSDGRRRTAPPADPEPACPPITAPDQLEYFRQA